MNENEELKKRYEKNRTDMLIKLLNSKATFSRFGNPIKNEPDVVYSLPDQESFGVEVTTAYFEEYQAKQEWNIFRNGFGNKKSVDLLSSTGQFFGNRSLEAIQNSINEKCAKRHEYIGVKEKWLLIWDDTLFTDRKDIKIIIQKLIIPEHPFEKIYIISHTQEANNFELFTVGQ